MLRVGGLLGRLIKPPSVALPTSVAAQLIPACFFSKYISKARTKRLPLTTKRVGKGYYKGNGARKEGRLNSKAQFFRDPEMCTELVVPDLTNFKLKAYVGVGAKRGVVEQFVEAS